VSVAAALKAPLVADRRFDAELKFNLFPALTVHRSWVSSMLGSFDDGDETAGAQSVFWMRNLSQALMREHELDHLTDFDFADNAKRTVLMDADAGLAVASLVSALLLRDAMRRVVLAPQVAALQRQLGAPLLAQALRWKEPLPSLPGMPAGVHDLSELLATTAEAEAWPRRAARLWLAMVPPAALGAMRRLRLKLPQAWRTLDAWRLGDMERRQIGVLFARVTPHAAPEWAWLHGASHGAPA
jgi:YOP proteins translocation protein K (YscK)